MLTRTLVFCAATVLAAGCSSQVGGPGSGSNDTQDDDQPSITPGTPDIIVRLGDEELAPNQTRAFELGRTRAHGFAPSVELTIENPGTAAVTLVANGGGAFSAALPSKLAAGATDTVTLVLEPASAGTYNGTIEVTTSVAGKGSYKFALSGTVLADDAMPLNPYHTTAPWKLWFVDDTPVDFTGIGGDGNSHSLTLAVPAIANRIFPTAAAIAATWPGVFLGKETAPQSPAAAGWWDDVSGTMDNGHSGPHSGWSGEGGNSINLTNQFISVNFGSPFSTQRANMGYNFTSESYAQRGAYLTRVGYNVTDTEANWLYANTVRGTPSYYSYNEYDAVYTSDNYDGLYGIGYQSLGRSSSETHALLKMLITSGFVPRATKELLKRHGLYATAMLTLFRQALPYVEADGTPVDYAGEMIQRPTYLSDGGATTDEFAPNNIVYHQYSNTLHLYRMIQGAKALTTPPPVAAMNLVSVASVPADGAPVVWAATDPRIKVKGKTTTTIWADPNDNLDIRVDMGESFDLNGEALEFSAKAVYPNQSQALHVEREENTAIFRIRATFDATLPLGRAPVIFETKVRGLRSNPVFLNVYWRQADQLDTPTEYFDATRGTGGTTNDKRKAVFWNARPTLTTSLGAATTMTGATGSAATFTVTCVDPEGFPTRIYRRAEDSGTLTNGTYGFTPMGSGNYPVAIICSDGTGAFASTRITIQVP